VLPPMLSYAQNGEDVVLRRAFAGQDSGFYVDVGACDPCVDSVTLHFYKQGWHGVNVEPDARLHAALVAARPRDVNLRVAIGQGEGTVRFFPTGTRGHGTLDSAIAADRTPAPAEEVPQLPLARVLINHAPPEGVDFLKVDVEGWEAAVLASADWTQVRPRVVLVEAVDAEGRPTHEAWEGPLLAAGYRFALFDGLNRFYCREEDAEVLLPRLAAPANVLDNYRLAREMQAQADAVANAIAQEAARREQEQARWEQEQARWEQEQAGREEQHRRAMAAMRQSLMLQAAEMMVQLEGTIESEAERVRMLRDLTANLQEQLRLAYASLEEEQRGHAAARTALAAAQQSLDGMTATLAELHASTSWRITAPLRKLGHLARLLRRGG